MYTYDICIYIFKILRKCIFFILSPMRKNNAWEIRQFLNGSPTLEAKVKELVVSVTLLWASMIGTHWCPVQSPCSELVGLKKSHPSNMYKIV